MHIDNNCFSKSARSATVISDIKDIIFYYLAYSKVHLIKNVVALSFPNFSFLPVQGKHIYALSLLIYFM